MVEKAHLNTVFGYNDNDDIRPLCIMFPQMIGYVQYFNDNKKMSFNVSDNKLLRKYTKILEKISNLKNKEFDSEPVYGDNDKYIKTNFQGKKISTK